MEPDEKSAKSKNSESQALAQDLEKEKATDPKENSFQNKGRSEQEKIEARRTQAMRFGLNAPLYGL